MQLLGLSRATLSTAKNCKDIPSPPAAAVPPNSTMADPPDELERAEKQSVVSAAVRYVSIMVLFMSALICNYQKK